MELLIQVLDDDRFARILIEINKVIEEDVRYEKGVLNMQSRKCCAIKVSFVQKIYI
jgi:hypothetical protein